MSLSTIKLRPRLLCPYLALRMDLNMFLALSFTNPSWTSTTINTDSANDSFENTHLELKGNEVKVGKEGKLLPKTNIYWIWKDIKNQYLYVSNEKYFAS